MEARICVGSWNEEAMPVGASRGPAAETGGAPGDSFKEMVVPSKNR